MTLFCFHFRAKQPEVDMPGPRRYRCVSEFMLHGTVLITKFSVHVYNAKSFVKFGTYQGIYDSAFTVPWLVISVF